MRKSTLFKNLQKAIRDYVENAKKTPCLVLDEAQYLPHKTLDELPIILNFRMDSLDPLVVIMIGHPHLAARLQRPPLPKPLPAHPPALPAACPQ